MNGLSAVHPSMAQRIPARPVYTFSSCANVARKSAQSRWRRRFDAGDNKREVGGDLELSDF